MDKKHPKEEIGWVSIAESKYFCCNVSEFSRLPRVLQIRLKSGYFKGFLLAVYSFPSRSSLKSLEALPRSVWSMRTTTTSSIANEKPQLFVDEAKKAIILMEILEENCFHVYRNAEEAISSLSEEASILHFFLLLPPKLLFIIISPFFLRFLLRNGF